MAVAKLATGKWQVQCFPNGRDGRRIRKQFSTKGEALAYERHVKDEAEQKPWLGEKQDKRTVSDLVDTWHRAHGVTLEDGDRRKDAMTYAYESMGKPLATEFNAKLFSQYREKRLSGELQRNTRVKKVSPRTVNLELAYFRAMFNELIRLDEWKAEHPLKNVRPYRTDESEMAFLRLEEIDTLLRECANSSASDLLTVVKICLATGARWSEAESLSLSQITKDRITFIKTKGKKNRTIPVSEELIKSIPKKESGEPLFVSCYSAFRTALKRAKINLPAGQLSHVLRHTFASHFMMAGGNILVLQRILGHTDIKMTMRYSHFSPNHLSEAIDFNPLNLIGIGSKVAAEESNPH
ncbi:TPA: tyrosine-type recombinase/integrase [Yersinia enterocolitica]|uniref:Bacteriophage integrase n=1 Tax=Yersinia mollaretii TaxID=33060 RepID=A0AA36LVG3_YERMO|nr:MULTISPECIES: tyrosine-type recombinase/integrase [Yersinia]ELW9026518.1 tyrosine-type recombinase/integrase [Yersinia enterocolitica]CNI68330.1 putative bacteriophage integrase [Yersinia mollaretii]CQJ26203.1 putative bacteriophage integrase [Yersinia mollaretii]HEN3568055.1 tyrosine-type recombinase/integrase [Yersinia enterocolitica]HEN3569401.1 tyrosine-type recombinase/integrase [Yersinia enterocolitica]